jgi:hypothetical protein
MDISYYACPLHDLISLCSTYLEMAGQDSSSFKRDFEVAQEMLPYRLTKDSVSMHLAQAL